MAWADSIAIQLDTRDIRPEYGIFELGDFITRPGYEVTQLNNKVVWPEGEAFQLLGMKYMDLQGKSDWFYC